MIKTVPTGNKVTRFDIWDNLARHEEELKGIGATDEDLKPLRDAAEVVSKAEKLDEDLSVDLLKILESGKSCLGFEVSPPTNEARYFARKMVERFVQGRVPADSASQLLIMAAGIYVLYLSGVGKKALIMRLLTDPNFHALLQDVLEAVAVNEVEIDQVTAEWMSLMNISPQKKKRGALKSYAQIRRNLKSWLARSTDTASSNPLPQPES